MVAASSERADIVTQLSPGRNSAQPLKAQLPPSVTELYNKSLLSSSSSWQAGRLADPCGKKPETSKKCSPTYFRDEGSASEGILEWAVSKRHRLTTLWIMPVQHQKSRVSLSNWHSGSHGRLTLWESRSTAALCVRCPRCFTARRGRRPPATSDSHGHTSSQKYEPDVKTRGEVENSPLACRQVTSITLSFQCCSILPLVGVRRWKL